MMSMRGSLCEMEVALRNSGWVVGFYVGHLPVYALVEAPKRAWSTRKTSRTSPEAMMRSSKSFVVMTAKNKSHLHQRRRD